jgi:uncharacterized RDD family membrane protein YckC
MTGSTLVGETPAPARLYARFSRRFWALALDSVVYAISIVLLIVLLEAVRGHRGGTGAVFFLWFGSLCFYEPLLVWRRGATLGHMAANLRVVDLDTGGNPTFLRALARFWLKTFLGLLAFAFMGTTRRHQALHDLIVRTTVEINDPAKARPEHYVEEREPISTVGLPSRRRRVLVIVAYSVLGWLAVGIALVSTQSSQCLEHTYACTPQERVAEDVVSLLYLALVAACIILGWTGRLPGARRTHAILQAAPPA